MQVFCALLFVFLALVQGDDHWKPTKRKFDIHYSKEEVKVEAVFKNGTYEDSFRLDVKTSNGEHDVVQFTFQYETKVDKNKTKLDLKYNFNNVIEFTSTAAVPVYGGDATTIVSYYPSKDSHAKWQPWEDKSAIIDGVQTYKYYSTNGVLSVTIQMSADPLSLSGLIIDPNSVKIDFEIHNFPYQGANNTRLALATTLRSKTQSKNKGEKAIVDHKLLFDNDPDMPLGSFSWVPTAQITDTLMPADIPIIAWSPETQKGHNFDVYFTFATPAGSPHPQHLVWDPRLGLDYDDESSGLCVGSICGGAAIGLIAGVAVVGLLFIVGLAVYISGYKRSGYQSLN